MQDRVPVLERRFAIYVLLTVRDHPGILKTELMRLEGGNEQTKFVRINELCEAGLLKVVEGSHWKAMALELTDKGKEVAEHLSEIEKILNSEQFT